MKKRRPTPCVGICSTTFGDLVCRGCKRFSHEIVDWNSYDDSQKEIIWERLEKIKEQVVGQIVKRKDEKLFQSAIEAQKINEQQEHQATYVLLQRLVRHSKQLSFAGLENASPDYEGNEEEIDSLVTLQQIDKEIVVRSRAFYELSYKVSA
tara:strand:+ start:230 stop:682 length:453 start_codon:yes stop_codon:yes gene_type:complete